MDVVQRQVVELGDKVDTLHGLVEQLTEKVSAIAARQSLSKEGGLRSESEFVNAAPANVRRPIDPSMTHKDILSDEPLLEADKSNTAHSLSPEIQIQRLTAQLTAAYNRMAALEEQILACRFQ
ncbi:MAG: hypothetical protein WA885_11810 [Phormidesmis sp.]